MSFPASGHGGISIDTSGLDPAFLSWYHGSFQGTRMIYGHWSGGLYTRAVGTYHRQIAVLEPLALDEMLDQYEEARKRRVGGAIGSLWHQVEQMKKGVKLQVFDNAPYDRDLAGHTRFRDVGSIAIAIMAGRGARPNDLGSAAPLPSQIDEMVRLIAEACGAVRSPAERFLTFSEAADNLDFPTMSDPRAPTPPYGFRTTREVIDLEAFIDVETRALAAPLQSPRPGWVRLGDWMRRRALETIAEQTRADWART